MLYRPPPIEIGPGCERTAFTISSIVVGVMISETAIGLSCVTSFTVGGGAGCVTGM
jgi:hypothetical protein